MCPNNYKNKRQKFDVWVAMIRSKSTSGSKELKLGAFQIIYKSLTFKKLKCFLSNMPPDLPCIWRLLVFSDPLVDDA